MKQHLFVYGVACAMCNINEMLNTMCSSDAHKNEREKQCHKSQIYTF